MLISVFWFTINRGNTIIRKRARRQKKWRASKTKTKKKPPNEGKRKFCSPIEPVTITATKAKIN